MNPMLYTFMEYLCTFLVTMAFLSNIAVRRTNRVKEPPVILAGRNITIGGWLFFSTRLWYLTLFDDSLAISPISLLAFSLIAFGVTIVSIGRLFAIKIDKPCDDCPYVRESIIMFAEQEKT